MKSLDTKIMELEESMKVRCQGMCKGSCSCPKGFCSCKEFTSYDKQDYLALPEPMENYFLGSNYKQY